jgi:hypothetical protein
LPARRLNMKSLLTVAAFLLPLLGTVVGQTREAEALRVLDDYLAAFNDQDFEAMAAVCHYPHVRIGGGEVSVWETAEEYAAPESRDAQQRFLKATGWHRSARESRSVLQSSADKVHILVRFTRYREDDSVIGTHDSLWILTKRDGRWGVQARSSFAPGADHGRDAVALNRRLKEDAPAPAVERDASAPAVADDTSAPAVERDTSAPAVVEDKAKEGPCAWFEWRTLMEHFPPSPEGAEIKKARRKRGSINRPQSKVTHRFRGVWIVEAVVDEKGKVRDARVMARPEIEPPWPAYEKAIIKSIRRWSFEPERVNGEPRPGCTKITLVDE